MCLGLNGWHRIGIVSSVIWFIGFAGYIWIYSTRDASDFYGSQLGMCYTILNVDNEALQYIGKQEDRNKGQTANWTKYEKCRSDATAFFNHTADNNYKGIPILLAVDFGTVLFGWLFVWFGIGITRWIKGGFRA
jgi:hypothetical protein